MGYSETFKNLRKAALTTSVVKAPTFDADYFTFLYGNISSVKDILFCYYRYELYFIERMTYAVINANEKNCAKQEYENRMKFVAAILRYRPDITKQLSNASVKDIKAAFDKITIPDMTYTRAKKSYIQAMDTSYLAYDLKQAIKTEGLASQYASYSKMRDLFNDKDIKLCRERAIIENTTGKLSNFQIASPLTEPSEIISKYYTSEGALIQRLSAVLPDTGINDNVIKVINFNYNQRIQLILSYILGCPNSIRYINDRGESYVLQCFKHLEEHYNLGMNIKALAKELFRLIEMQTLALI